MENDSFLKKFLGRIEVIGRGGLLDIMQIVHINVNDYQIKVKKTKIKTGKKSVSKKRNIIILQVKLAQNLMKIKIILYITT